jgi:hypothetical protein
MLKERMAQVPDWACVEDGNFLVFHSTKIPPEHVRSVIAHFRALLKSLAREYPCEGLDDALFVIRLCKDWSQYQQYGGPSDSTGYWSPGEREMVTYVNSGASTWRPHRSAGLLVHAYFAEALAGMAPHDWFAVGLATFYERFTMGRHGNLLVEKNRDHEGAFRKAREDGTLAPVERFLRFEHHEFMGERFGRNAAQAWSFTWFLKTQRAPEWSGLLASYYAALRSGVRETLAREGGTGPVSDGEADRIRKSAVDTVFGGFDQAKWRDLEKAWLEFP